MGFRFRKSINLSKSGIGYSFGVPGLRYTKSTNPQYPKCKYSLIKIENEIGINLSIMVSSCEKINVAKGIYKELKESNSNETTNS